jgi:hypothetical protein
MSSWRRIPSQKRAPATLRIDPIENAGFFSNCSSRLEQILTYYNGITRPPTTIDSYQQFALYKPADCPPEQSIIEQFFLEKVNGKISFFHPIMFKQTDQFTDYRKLPLKDILPFIRRYFTPSSIIDDLVTDLLKKYTIKPDNTCVLFYRGNDKETETILAPYDDYLIRARAILAKNPKVRFLIQSDETEFIETMQANLPNTFFFADEIRHIRKSNTSVDLIKQEENYQYALQFQAIMIIMSRCRDIVFGSGNCSIWLLFFRGLTDRDSPLEGIQQFLDGNWLSGPLRIGQSVR